MKYLQSYPHQRLGEKRQYCASVFLFLSSYTYVLRQNVKDLTELLDKERGLEEQAMNKERETRRQLERLQKFSNPETLSTVNIASQVRDTIKKKSFKLLQTDYVMLQVAYKRSEEKFTADLQAEAEKNKHLQRAAKVVRLMSSICDSRLKPSILSIRGKCSRGHSIKNIMRSCKKHTCTARSLSQLSSRGRSKRTSISKKKWRESMIHAKRSAKAMKLNSPT